MCACVFFFFFLMNEDDAVLIEAPRGSGLGGSVRFEATFWCIEVFRNCGMVILMKL